MLLAVLSLLGSSDCLLEVSSPLIISMILMGQHRLLNRRVPEAQQGHSGCACPAPSAQRASSRRTGHAAGCPSWVVAVPACLQRRGARAMLWQCWQDETHIGKRVAVCKRFVTLHGSFSSIGQTRSSRAVVQHRHCTAERLKGPGLFRLVYAHEAGYESPVLAEGAATSVPNSLCLLVC